MHVPQWIACRHQAKHRYLRYLRGAFVLLLHTKWLCRRCVLIWGIVLRLSIVSLQLLLAICYYITQISWFNPRVICSYTTLIRIGGRKWVSNLWKWLKTAIIWLTTCNMIQFECRYNFSANNFVRRCDVWKKYFEFVFMAHAFSWFRDTFLIRIICVCQLWNTTENRLCNDFISNKRFKD